MANGNGIPVGFKRVAPATSDSSEHSPEASMNLSDLVNSFMERGEAPEKNDDFELSEPETANSWNSKMEVELRRLLENSVEGHDQFREEIREEIEPIVYGDFLVSSTSSERKRILMNRLRDRGFDAGLCKSKWVRTGNHPSGSYEYIDIKQSDIRYIIEVEISNEFAIARQSKSYSSLLDLFPSVFIGKAEDLMKIVRLMCKAMRNSLQSVDMPMPPWRTDGYMKAKWFSEFRRTTNEFPLQKGLFSVTGAKRRSDGFETAPIRFTDCNCRKNLGGGKVGLLALALNSPAIYL